MNTWLRVAESILDQLVFDYVSVSKKSRKPEVMR